MALLSGEERVAKDTMVKISSKNVLDLSGYFELSRGYDGKFSPISR